MYWGGYLVATQDGIQCLDETTDELPFLDQSFDGKQQNIDLPQCSSINLKHDKESYFKLYAFIMGGKRIENSKSHTRFLIQKFYMFKEELSLNITAKYQQFYLSTISDRPMS